MKLSQYQIDAISSFEEGKSIAIQATAGSGKTFILSQFAQISNPYKKACIVFNKHNVSQLESKFPSSWSGCLSTSHSFFFRLLKRTLGVNRIAVNGFKYHDIALDYLKGRDLPCPIADIVKIFNQYRISACHNTFLDVFTDKYVYHEGLKVKNWARLYTCLEFMLSEGLGMLSQKVDFIDMIWGFYMKGNPVHYELVMVDECQDLNPLTIQTLKMTSPSQFVCVGDRNQAIMGFAGADIDSFDNLKAAFKCEELPLSICYRCPDSHISLVHNLLPQVNIEGTRKAGQVIKGIDYENVDLIVCRYTAPLISLCFQLIADGKPARVRGKDIGKGLASIVKSAIKDGCIYSDFPEWLERWEDREISKINPNSHTFDDKIEAISEKKEVILIFYRKSEKLTNILLLIDQMFTDDEQGFILLSTIHRCKGLEYPKVGILQSSELPINDHQQELNCLFVALTRATNTLYLA